MRTARMMVVLAGLALIAAPVVQAQARQRGFSVVLLLGDVQAGPASDNVPAGVRTALADVKDFLPYKSYRLLDTQWVPTSKGGASRLHGVDGRDYDVTIRADEILGGPHAGMLDASFTLQEPGASRKLIDSRFEMAVGETVVVGTSRLGGDSRALIVLLTAVAAKEKP